MLDEERLLSTTSLHIGNCQVLAMDLNALICRKVENTVIEYKASDEREVEACMGKRWTHVKEILESSQMPTLPTHI